MTPTNGSTLRDRVLILAPVGRDASLAQEVLAQRKIPCHVCTDVEVLCAVMREGAGAVLLGAEAILSVEACERLISELKQQADWSALPVIVLAAAQPATRAGARTLQELEMMRNVTFLSRPIRVVSLLSTLRAAIEARRRQYEVRDLLDRLQEGVRRRDEFLAMLGHELGNPLSAIQISAELLREKAAQKRTDLRPQIDIIVRQAGHLASLVGDLLDVSRVTRGKIRLRPVQVDVRQAVAEAIESCSRPLEERRHRLEVQAPDAPVWVEADPTRLQQVLTNLIVNAAKYTDEGGHIRVSVERDRGAAIVRVADNGVGMTDETLASVFDLFAQGRRDLDRSTGGLGIGLTLTRRLVEMHGGSIAAHSPGLAGGSEFVVRLPEGAPRPQDVTERSAMAGRELRILLVDDNEDFALSLSEVIRSLGHEVHVVHDGPSALLEAESRHPHLVLLDIGLPGMNGFEVAEELRSRNASDPTIVAVTGYGGTASRRRAREIGFDDFLVKPVATDTLVDLFGRFGGT